MIVWILIAIAALAAVAGFMVVTELTFGVYLVGLACFIGIVARIVQAGRE